MGDCIVVFTLTVSTASHCFYGVPELLRLTRTSSELGVIARQLLHKMKRATVGSKYVTNTITAVHGLLAACPDASCLEIPVQVRALCVLERCIVSGGRLSTSSLSTSYARVGQVCCTRAPVRVYVRRAPLITSLFLREPCVSGYMVHIMECTPNVIVVESFDDASMVSCCSDVVQHPECWRGLRCMVAHRPHPMKRLSLFGQIVELWVSWGRSVVLSSTRSFLRVDWFPVGVRTPTGRVVNVPGDVTSRSLRHPSSVMMRELRTYEYVTLTAHADAPGYYNAQTDSDCSEDCDAFNLLEPYTDTTERNPGHLEIILPVSDGRRGLRAAHYYMAFQGVNACTVNMRPLESWATVPDYYARSESPHT